MRTLALIGIGIIVSFSSGLAQQPPPARDQRSAPVANPDKATYISSQMITGTLAKMTDDRPTQEWTFIERPDAYRLSVEHRKLPQRPAVHEREAEIWMVVAGTATITTGGTIVGGTPNAQNSTNVFGKVIQGGTEQRVATGDMMMIPEGVPHQITAADPTLKFIVFELTRPQTTLKNY
jgi:mannose-6-phosphate isomerase-like protein (cupin superfamily)